MRTSKKNSTGEVKIKGQGASPGIALGKAFVFNRHKPIVNSRSIHKSQVEEQCNEFRRALKLTHDELKAMLEEDLDPETHQIIQTQIEMVNDPELCQQVERLVKEELYSADYAIQRVFKNYLELLTSSDNHVMRERIIDVKDIRDRLIQYLNKQASTVVQLDGEQILVAKELSPREVIKLSGGRVKGIVMDRGGPTCHAAIIARALGIPAVVGAKKASELIQIDTMVALDGDSGLVVVNPSDSTIEDFNAKIAGWSKHLADLKNICHLPSNTQDGHSFTLRANIEFAHELENLESFNAQGIGLLRTESIYLSKESFQNLDKQEAFYASILDKTGYEPVTIRLFDAGGDKFFNTVGEKEDNPFLGWRGIRMLLDEPRLLRDQLKAIQIVAGKFPGRVKILAPMVTSITEVKALRNHMKDTFEQLEREGYEVDSAIELGIMVEVPSVAVMAEKFAEHVDFFSIGTNDLTQYTLAVDRGNELISGLFNQRHPAVWHMIKRAVDAAKRHEIGISVCGELASDPESAACLMGMGIGELSMSPLKIPGVKQLLVSCSLDSMKSLSEEVLNCSTVEEVNKLFDNWKNQN
jgi:phosphotransferase system enzyme I (PtsI)